MTSDIPSTASPKPPPPPPRQQQQQQRNDFASSSERDLSPSEEDFRSVLPSESRQPLDDHEEDVEENVTVRDENKTLQLLDEPEDSPALNYYTIGLRTLSRAYMERALTHSSLRHLGSIQLFYILNGQNMVRSSTLGEDWYRTLYTHGALFHVFPRVGGNIDDAPTKALVLTPTPELAWKIAAKTNFENVNVNIQVAISSGGSHFAKHIKRQTLTQRAPAVPWSLWLNGKGAEWRKVERHCETVGPDIVVGTPGKIADWIKRGTIDPAAVKMLVLDGADKMDSQLRAHTISIEKLLAPECQRLVFSDSFPGHVTRFVHKLVRDDSTAQSRVRTGSL